MPRRLRITLIVSLVSLVVALWAAAGARGAYGDPRLDALASTIAARPVQISCASGANEWAKTQQANGFTFETDGFTYVGRSNIVYLSPLVCEVVLGVLDHGPAAVGTYFAARAIKVFIHESVHQGGLTDEHVTDCTAITLLRVAYAPRFGYPKTIKKTTYARIKGTNPVRYKAVVKVVTNPQYTSLISWANYWHFAVPTFGGAC